MLSLPRIVRQEEYQAIDDEWRRLPDFKLPEHIKASDDIDCFWHKLLNFGDDDQLGYTFKKLSKFALNVLSIPHANAECERTFSAVNLAKTKVRNQLITPTVKSILLTKQRIKQNCVEFEPSLDDYSRMTYKNMYNLTDTVQVEENVVSEDTEVIDVFLPGDL